jgi:hypothetical protein
VRVVYTHHGQRLKLKLKPGATASHLMWLQVNFVIEFPPCRSGLTRLACYNHVVLAVLSQLKGAQSLSRVQVLVTARARNLRFSEVILVIQYCIKMRVGVGESLVWQVINTAKVLRGLTPCRVKAHKMFTISCSKWMAMVNYSLPSAGDSRTRTTALPHVFLSSRSCNACVSVSNV